MALVNPNIAMSYRPTTEYQPRNALAEYAQIQSIMGGQRQAEVADMQLESLRRDRDALSQIQAAIVAKGGPPDLGAAADAMIKSGRPEYLQQGLRIREILGQQQKLEAYEREYPSGAAAPSAVPAAAAAPAAGEGAPNALVSAGAAAAAPAAANAMRPAAQPDVNALMMQYRRAAAAGSPDAPAILKQVEAALRGDQTRPVAVSPGQVVYDPRSGQAVYTAPAAPERPLTVRPGEIVIDPKSGQAVYTAPAAPITARPGEVVIDPRSGQQIFAAPANTALSDRFVPVGRLVFDRQTQQYISPTQAQLAQSQERAPAAPGAGQRAPSGYRFTPAGELEPIPGGPASTGLAPREIQKREATYPQATQAVRGFEAKSESFIKDLELLRNHPGLSQITGFVAGRVPGVTADGRAAQALYDKIVAKGGFQALQDMRDASKTGGALGNVSNQEGKQLVASFAAIDRRQNAPDVQAAIDQAIADIRGSQTRMREAYDETYSYRTPQDAAGRQLPARGVIIGNTVNLPDGRTMKFPNAKAAADFKKAAGL